MAQHPGELKETKTKRVEILLHPSVFKKSQDGKKKKVWDSPSEADLFFSANIS